MTTEAHSLTLRYKDGGLAAGVKSVNKFAESGEKASKSMTQFTGQIGKLNTQIKTIGSVTIPKTVSGFDKFTRGLKPAKNATQLVSFQVQDLAVQLAAGTSAMVAFGQQTPQLASAFGPSGAVLGAIAGIGFAIAGPLITALSSAKVETESLGDTMIRLNSSFTEAADGSDILSKELVRLAKISKESVRLRLIIDQEDAAKALTKARNEIVMTLTSFSDHLSALEKLSGVTAFDKLAEGLGITTEEAERLSKAIPDIANKENIDSYNHLAGVLSDIKDSYGSTNKEVNSLSRSFNTQIGLSIDAAEAMRRLKEANQDLDKSIDVSRTKSASSGGFSDPEGDRLAHLFELNKMDVADKKRTEAEKTRITTAAVRHREAVERSTISAATSTMANLVEIAKAGGEESFQTYKRLAQTQAAMSAALGIMSVIADPLIPTAFKPIAIAATAGLAAVQIAQIDAQQYSARENGGQVMSGSKVLVGERGPEVLEIGAQGGFITPNSRLGGGESITVVNQIGNGVSGNVRAEITSALPAIIAATTKAVRSGRR